MVATENRPQAVNTNGQSPMIDAVTHAADDFAYGWGVRRGLGLNALNRCLWTTVGFAAPAVAASIPNQYISFDLKGLLWTIGGTLTGYLLSEAYNVVSALGEGRRERRWAEWQAAQNDAYLREQIGVADAYATAIEQSSEAGVRRYRPANISDHPTTWL